MRFAYFTALYKNLWDGATSAFARLVAALFGFGHSPSALLLTDERPELELDLTGKVQVDPSPLDANYGSASGRFEDGVYKGYFVDSADSDAQMNAERVTVAFI